MGALFRVQSRRRAPLAFRLPVGGSCDAGGYAAVTNGQLWRATPGTTNAWHFRRCCGPDGIHR
eukprot:scaffold5496_cov112-Isochrysis_galbana.AAC.8